MFKNYFTTAYRNIIRNKWFSLINVFGLASSLAICMLIIALKQDQQNYDQFHKNKSNIYRVVSEVQEANATFATCPPPLEAVLRGQYPEIKETTQLKWAFDKDITFNTTTAYATGFYAAPSFFEIFDFELKYGDTNTALQSPFSLILYEDIAEKMNINGPQYIGRSISVKDVGEFTLTGIAKKNTQRTHLTFDVLSSFSTLSSLQKQGKIHTLSDAWQEYNDTYLYLLLEDFASTDKLENALDQISEKHYPDVATRTYFQLQSLGAISGEQLVNSLNVAIPDFVIYALSILALLILLTACFNYTNLTVAKSIVRGKEIGVRKVIGANRRQIFFQFLTESVALALLAFLIAIPFLNKFLIPQIQSLVFFSEIRMETTWWTYVLFFLTALVVGGIAGILPALHLSNIQPLHTLKNNVSTKIFAKIGWRKALMGLQFLITVLFFITTIIVYKQTNHLLYASYGFEQENIVNIKLKEQDFELLKTELSKEPKIIGVTGVSMMPGLGGRATSILKRYEEDDEIDFDKLYVHEGFIELLDIELLAGRTIQTDDPTDQSQVIINKTAMERLGWNTPEEAVGQEIFLHESEENIPTTIIGVIDNIYHFLIMSKADPLFLTYKPDNVKIASVKIQGDHIPETITAIQNAWTTLMPDISFDYYFYDTRLRQNLAPFSIGAKIISFLTFIILLIMSLGLLGLASYTVQTRKKEISIRKILGGNRHRITWTISKGMLTAIGLALLIGFPLAIFLNNLWLQNIANGISLTFLNVGIGGLFLALLAFLIIASQAYWMANQNPVDSLRGE